MFVPEMFAEKDPARLRAFVKAEPFAILVTSPVGGEVGPFASHVPLLLDETRGPAGILTGHLARKNRQWRDFGNGTDVLAIFSGPHTFVSSLWYGAPEQHVPTWNYVAVHVYGRARVLEGLDHALHAVRSMVAAFQPEGHPLSLDPPAALAETLARAIVPFEIEISRWEGKIKLSQNREPDDRQRVEDALRARGGADDVAIADWMKLVRSG